MLRMSGQLHNRTEVAPETAGRDQERMLTFVLLDDQQRPGPLQIRSSGATGCAATSCRESVTNPATTSGASKLP
jgi:hypothetical protein